MLKLIAADTNASPTDVASFLLSLLQADSNASPTDAVQLGFPAPDFADSSAVPTDTIATRVDVWLAGSAGANVATPSNADGMNNGTFAVLQTDVTTPATETLTSTVGANIPSLSSLSSAIYRGWFISNNTLGTSTGIIEFDYSGGHIIMFTNSAVATTVDHQSGTFTFDLMAAGVNTIAKLQSITNFRHRVTDAAPGVTPHTMSVDAGRIELTGTF